MAVGDAAPDAAVDMGAELEALILSDQVDMEDQWVQYRELAVLFPLPLPPLLPLILFWSTGFVALRGVSVSVGLFWANVGGGGEGGGETRGGRIRARMEESDQTVMWWSGGEA